MATGVVAVSAVVEGFRSARNTMKQILKGETVEDEMGKKVVEADMVEITEEYVAEETREGALAEKATEKVGTE